MSVSIDADYNENAVGYRKHAQPAKARDAANAVVTANATDTVATVDTTNEIDNIKQIKLTIHYSIDDRYSAKM